LIISSKKYEITFSGYEKGSFSQPEKVNSFKNLDYY